MISFSDTVSTQIFAFFFWIKMFIQKINILSLFQEKENLMNPGRKHRL